METSTGMAGIIDQLVTGFTPETFFSVLGDVMPFVIRIVPLALGYFILRKLVKGSAKAKVNF